MLTSDNYSNIAHKIASVRNLEGGIIMVTILFIIGLIFIVVAPLVWALTDKPIVTSMLFFAGAIFSAISGYLEFIA